VWVLAQSRRDGHRSLVTPKRVLSENNKDLFFFVSVSDTKFPTAPSLYITINLLILPFSGVGAGGAGDAAASPGRFLIKFGKNLSQFGKI